MNRVSDESSCVLITGATGGIGRALSQRLAGDGWRLHLCDVSESALQALAASLPDTTTTSVSLLDSPEACASVVADVPGRLAGLAHLAGVFDFHDFDANGRDVYRHTMQHNPTNAYDLTAAVEPRIVQGGRIVFTSSLAFNRGAPDNVSYSMAKGALVGLTRALSRRLAPQGILVNAVAPGLIESPMLDKVMSQRDRQASVSGVPLGRTGQPEEVAGVISFLLSADASYVTGQLINIDGGLINS